MSDEAPQLTRHGWNAEGWYIGLVADDAPRSTHEAPPTTSTDATPGAERARRLRIGWRVEVQPQPAPAVVPMEVPMWAAREVLIDADLLDTVLAMVAAIEDPTERRKAENRFEFATVVRRDDPLLQRLVPDLGITDQQLDAMFIAAKALSPSA